MDSGSSPSPTPVRNLPERLQDPARPQGRPIPGDQAVAAAEGGGVQLEDGGDVVALGHGHQRVHHLLLGVAQPAAGGVLVGVRLGRRGLGSGRRVQTPPLTAGPGPQEGEPPGARDRGRKGTASRWSHKTGADIHVENSLALPPGVATAMFRPRGLRAERHRAQTAQADPAPAAGRVAA